MATQNTQIHLYRSKSISELADSVSTGLKWQKRLSNKMTNDERDEFELEVLEWCAERVFIEKSKSLEYPNLKRNKI